MLKRRFVEPDYLPATPELVATRFKQLFQLHGIEIPEIPQVEGFQNITLHDLHSDEALLQKLRPRLLQETADTFGIRIEWLRSGEPAMYQHRHWYKSSIKDFFEDLKAVDFESTYDPFIVLTTQEKLDVNNPEYQPFILVLRKHLTTLDDKDVYTYLMESVWDWHHPPCRLQAKALVTQYYKLTHRLVTMFTVDQATFQQIAGGYIPPNGNLSRNHKISFEEYGALKLEYMEPYEKNEFDAVVATIKEHGLDAISHPYVTKSDLGDSNQTASKVKRGRQPNHNSREIKERYMEAFGKKISRGEISADQAARDFFAGLTEEERVWLFRSPKEYADLTYEEAEKRAERTLSEYYANQKPSI